MFDEQIAMLWDQPVTDLELRRARLNARHWQVTDNVGFLARASRLAEAAVVFGDANLINTEPRQLAKVTKRDVQRVARKYFTAANRTVIITVPPSK